MALLLGVESTSPAIHLPFPYRRGSRLATTSGMPAPPSHGAKTFQAAAAYHLHCFRDSVRMRLSQLLLALSMPITLRSTQSLRLRQHRPLTPLLRAIQWTCSSPSRSTGRWVTPSTSTGTNTPSSFDNTQQAYAPELPTARMGCNAGGR